MSRRELETIVREMVKSIVPDLKENPDVDAKLTSSVYFDRVDLLYLYLLIGERFPEITIPAKDLEDGKFNSIAGIVEILSVCGV